MSKKYFFKDIRTRHFSIMKETASHYYAIFLAANFSFVVLFFYSISAIFFILQDKQDLHNSNFYLFVIFGNWNMKVTLAPLYNLSPPFLRGIFCLPLPKNRINKMKFPIRLNSPSGFSTLLSVVYFFKTGWNLNKRFQHRWTEMLWLRPPVPLRHDLHHLLMTQRRLIRPLTP